MDNHDYKNFDLIDKTITENNVIVDVGANIGEYTDFFIKKLNSTGKIYTLELSPDTCQELKNKYIEHDNVTVMNYAVSDVDGDIPYYEGNHHCLHNIIGHDVNFNETKISGTIKSIRLDTLLSHEDKIDLIKIDVEGAELLVLRGCMNIIDKVDNILVECHLKKDWEDIKKLLLNDYKLDCFNNSCDVEGIVKLYSDSPLSYQCFCKRKK